MDQTKPATPSGLCKRCGWSFPNPHPSPKRRRAHKKICGTIEGFTNKLIVENDVEDDEHHSDSDGEQTPSPKTDKSIIKESGSSAGGVEEKPSRSEDDMFSAATEFSDTGISPGVTSEVKKFDEKSESFEFPTTRSKDADKHSVPSVEHHDGCHKDKVIDQTEPSNTVQHQGENVHDASVTSDTPIVDKAETLIEDFKDHKTVYSIVVASSDEKHGESSGSMVDVFEVKSVQEDVQKSQQSDHEESASGSAVVNEEEASGDKHLVMTLGELIQEEIKKSQLIESKSGIEAKGKIVETAVSDSKAGVKIGSSKTIMLTSQRSGIDSSFGSSSYSLEGHRGSVSDISDVFGKSEKRLERLDAFKDPSLVESELKASEIEKDKGKKTQSPKSEESISKVTNWSTSGHIGTAPLKKLMRDAMVSNPKPSSSVIKKDEDAAISSQPEKSIVIKETPEVNQESSKAQHSSEGKIVKKKKSMGISTFLKYACCSTPPITK